MATTLLTVSTDTLGGYWQGHPTAPLCAGERRVDDDACAGEITIGNTVDITAYPDTNYFVSNWDVQSSTGVVPTLTLAGDTYVSQTASFVYLEAYGDVTIVVSFTPVVCQLTLSVGVNSGILNLISPSGKIGDIVNDSVVVSIDASAGDSTNIVVKATGHAGYIVDGWTLDGSVHDGSSFSTAGYSERVLVVNFTPEVACTKDKQLTVSISGSGSVTAQNVLYCDTDIINIYPIAANGWVFDRWSHDGSSGISEIGGNVLRVVMDTDRTNITAIFVQGASVGISDNLFYCPSDNYKNNVISFNFTNSDNYNDPSVDNLYHFRLNFYTDIDKNKLVYSAFSLSDNKRWFLNDGNFSQLSSEGIDVDISHTVNIVYDPEILPSQITESQKPHLINNSTVVYEKPLVCGIKYYVEVQAYEVDTNRIIGIETIPLILDCNRIDSYYWNYNKDKNNWLCSGQGKTDLKVCGGFGQAVNPSIDSNLFGIFKIAWQGRRVFKNTNGETIRENNIYSAAWNSKNDILHSSGQGLYDTLEMDEGNNPIVIRDPSLNFYISGATKDNIKYKECDTSYSAGGTTEPPVVSTPNFEAFCYSGESTLLSASYDEIKVRVYGEDVSDSLTINDEKAVSVVNKRSIRLDVDGIVGAYAVRVRNMEDPSWGEWINIDNELYEGGIGDDEYHDAYRIDNNRFLVQWDINNYNGLRRICCQVLTMYGISNIFCIEVLANFDVPQHAFKFYIDELKENEFPIYDGQYVLSLNVEGVTPVEGKATVYFDAIFSQPVYKDETSSTEYAIGEVKYNLIQQGINDRRNIDFESITSNTFSGSFEISQNDGIFNKDGAAFIEIVFPEAASTNGCTSDERDKYNFVNSDIGEIANIDLIPEEVYQKYQRDSLSKALDIDKFKQNYDNDDANFKFGNPGHYRK